MSRIEWGSAAEAQFVAQLQPALTAAVDAAAEVGAADPVGFVAEYLAKHRAGTAAQVRIQRAVAHAVEEARTAELSADENSSPLLTVELWLQSLELHKQIAPLVLAPLQAATGGQQDTRVELPFLRALGRDATSRSDIRVIIDQLLCGATQQLVEKIVEGIEGIERAVPAAGAERDAADELLNGKFANEAQFDAAMGNLDVFYGGLDKLVGVARLTGDPPSYWNTMRTEHCDKLDSKALFEASNMNGAKTRACDEWAFVAEPDPGKVYTERKGLRADLWRTQKTVEELAERMTEKNAELRDKKHEPLVIEEAIGARLYTGPMCTPMPPNLCARPCLLADFLRFQMKSTTWCCGPRARSHSSATASTTSAGATHVSGATPPHARE